MSEKPDVIVGTNFPQGHPEEQTHECYGCQGVVWSITNSIEGKPPDFYICLECFAKIYDPRMDLRGPTSEVRKTCAELGIDPEAHIKKLIQIIERSQKRGEN